MCVSGEGYQKDSCPLLLSLTSVPYLLRKRKPLWHQIPYNSFAYQQTNKALSKRRTNRVLSRRLKGTKRLDYQIQTSKSARYRKYRAKGLPGMTTRLGHCHLCYLSRDVCQPSISFKPIRSKYSEAHPLQKWIL
jgi:hypothetical protein